MRFSGHYEKMVNPAASVLGENCILHNAFAAFRWVQRRLQKSSAACFFPTGFVRHVFLEFTNVRNRFASTFQVAQKT